MRRLLVAALFLSGCVDWEVAGSPPATLRSISVAVLDYQRNPAEGVTLVSSYGQTVLDTQQTGPGGFALLRVVDGGMITAHVLGSWFDGPAHFAETVIVLPTDEAITLRFLYLQESIRQTVNVNISGLAVGHFFFETIVSGEFCTGGAHFLSQATNSLLSLDIDTSQCGLQDNGLYSVWGEGVNTDTWTHNYGAVRDLAFNDTAAALTLAPDAATPINVAIGSLRSPPWWIEAASNWSGLMIGDLAGGNLTVFTTSTSNSLMVRGIPSADAVRISVLDSRGIFERVALPPGITSWTFEGNPHPPTITGSSVLDTNGTIVAGWTTAGDGDAEVMYANISWAEPNNLSHFWLLALPATTGKIEEILPPLPSTFGTVLAPRFVSLGIAYRVLDYVHGYPVVRDLPRRPRFYDERISRRGTLGAFDGPANR